MSQNINGRLQERSVVTAFGQIYYYFHQGSRRNPTVLLLHGLSANHTTWLNTAKELIAKNYTVIAPDLRGHGKSDKTKQRDLYCWKVMSEDLKLILDQEKISKVVILGYSFGGSVAIDFAWRYSPCVGGVMLVSTNHYRPMSYLRLAWLANIGSYFLEVMAVMLRWQNWRKYQYYHPNSATGYWPSVRLGLKTMPISVNFWLLNMMHRLDMRSKLPGLKMPVLIVHSRHDPFLSDREIIEMSSALPKVRVIASKNDSHFIATKAKTEMNKLLLQFLTQYENSDF
ncbi:MAG: alpha/beta hydrolase [Candidatus Falkowbacteria bacterium]